MIAGTSIRLNLLLIACLAFSCNQVKEVQEPDLFAVAEDWPAQNIQLSGDSTEINVLKPNQIKEPVTLEFSKPFHGILSENRVAGKLYYKPDAGFLGTDTIQYRICRMPDCRPGKILIEVQPNPAVCLPVYSMVDTQFVNLVSGPGIKAVPLFPEDKYCANDVKEVHSFYPGISSFEFSDSLRFLSQLSASQKRSFLISYSNTDFYKKSKLRFVRVNLVPDVGFCDQYFRIEERESPIMLQRDDTLTLSRESFGYFLKICEGDLDSSFFQLTASPNLQVSQPVPGKYKIWVRPFGFGGPARLQFKFRNIRGLIREGQFRIQIHQKRP